MKKNNSSMIDIGHLLEMKLYAKPITLKPISENISSSSMAAVDDVGGAMLMQSAPIYSPNASPVYFTPFNADSPSFDEFSSR